MLNENLYFKKYAAWRQIAELHGLLYQLTGDNAHKTCAEEAAAMAHQSLVCLMEVQRAGQYVC